MATFFVRFRGWRKRRMYRDVLREAAAVLGGTAIERYVRPASSLPPWTALNGVAHGDLRRVRTLAAVTTPLGLVVSDPLDATALIAREVAAAVGDDVGMLMLLQTMVLIPLEAELLRLPASARVSPGELVAAVHAGLTAVLS